jgi:protein TonB
LKAGIPDTIFSVEAPKLSHRILLIDPDPANAELVQQPLLEAGYDITLVSDANAGLEHFLRLQPDLAVIEAELPDRPGLDLCADIKSTLTGKNVPVIILSNTGAENVGDACCDIVIEKPFIEEELLDSCERLLRRAGEPAVADNDSLLDAQDLESAIEQLDTIITPQELAPPTQEGEDIADHLDSLFAGAETPGTRTETPQQPLGIETENLVWSEAQQPSSPTVEQTVAPTTAPKRSRKKIGIRKFKWWLLAVVELIILVGVVLYYLQPAWLFKSPVTQPPVVEIASPQQASPVTPPIEEPAPPAVEQTPEAAPVPAPEPKPEPEPEPEPVVEATAEIPVNTVKIEPIVPEPEPEPEPAPVAKTETRKLNVMATSPTVNELPVTPQATVVAEPVITPEPTPEPTPVAVPFSAAKAKSKIQPAFTPKMLESNTDAEIVLSALIDERGRVIRIKVRQGTPGSPLVNAAIDAILQTQYTPATEGGEPVRSWTTERFSLED